MKKGLLLLLILAVALLSSVGTTQYARFRAEMRVKKGYGALRTLLIAASHYRERKGICPPTINQQMYETREEESLLRDSLVGYSAHIIVIDDNPEQYSMVVVLQAMPQYDATLIGVCSATRKNDKWEYKWTRYFRGEVLRTAV